MQTLQQKYASRVYTKIKAYEENEDRKKYGAMALKLPILIHTAGLAQALAFVQSRGKKPFDQLLEDLAQVVNEKDAESFVKKSREVKLEEYIYLTKQTMTALEWFKRYAQSILKVETTDAAED
jgi:CRISPR-associated protein Cmr5